VLYVHKWEERKKTMLEVYVTLDNIVEIKRLEAKGLNDLPFYFNVCTIIRNGMDKGAEFEIGTDLGSYAILLEQLG